MEDFRGAVSREDARSPYEECQKDREPRTRKKIRNNTGGKRNGTELTDSNNRAYQGVRGRAGRSKRGNGRAEMRLYNELCIKRKDKEDTV